jgi:hypothetical protein
LACSSSWDSSLSKKQRDLGVPVLGGAVLGFDVGEDVLSSIRRLEPTQDELERSFGGDARVALPRLRSCVAGRLCTMRAEGRRTAGADVGSPLGEVDIALSVIYSALFVGFLIWSYVLIARARNRK